MNRSPTDIPAREVRSHSEIPDSWIGLLLMLAGMGGTAFAMYLDRSEGMMLFTLIFGLGLGYYFGARRG